MDLGTGLAILGPSLSIGGIGIAIIGRLLPLARASTQGTGDPVQRPEFERYCKSTDTAFDDIKNMLSDINFKMDQNLSELARKTEDHEKRLGVIEARHRDLTGDRLQAEDDGGSRVGLGDLRGLNREARPDRRYHSRAPDLGYRRRKSDPEHSMEGEIREETMDNGKTKIGFS